MNKRQPKSRAVAESDLVFLREMPTGGGSDLTLKKNITDLLSALCEIKELRPVAWNWKDNEDGRREYGFIAQEVEKVLPELVYTDTWVDGTKRKFLSSKSLLAYLIAAMQELHAEVEELKMRLEATRKSGTNRT